MVLTSLIFFTNCYTIEEFLSLQIATLYRNYFLKLLPYRRTTFFKLLLFRGTTFGFAFSPDLSVGIRVRAIAADVPASSATPKIEFPTPGALTVQVIPWVWIDRLAPFAQLSFLFSIISVLLPPFRLTYLSRLFKKKKVF